MAWHNLLIAKPAKLSIKHGQLCCKQKESSISIAMEDIASIVIESPQVTLTAPVLTTCSINNVTLITCDEQHMPCGLLLPFAQHSRNLPPLKMQINATKPLQKRIWQKMVQNKILNQALLLEHFQCNKVKQLKMMAKQVDSGDSKNFEAQAAKLYFSNLFSNFTRHENDITNSALNYTYAIIRACIARSVVAYGLHPSLGIHHCNELNAFNLADDFIEVFRPIADSWVKAQSFESEQKELTLRNRSILIQALQLEVIAADKKHRLQVAVDLYVKSFLSALKNKDSQKLITISPVLPAAIKDME